MFNKIFKVNGDKSFSNLIISILIAEGVGLLSGYLGRSNPNTYMQFNKPSFSPPSWVFPVVWTILFFLMAIAVYRIWIRGKQGEDITKPLILYTVQLILNFFWTIIFFRFNLYGVAFIELLVLLVIVIITTFSFKKIDRLAAYLMIPYILWLGFAGILNYAIWMLNI